MGLLLLESVAIETVMHLPFGGQGCKAGNAVINPLVVIACALCCSLRSHSFCDRNMAEAKLSLKRTVVDEPFADAGTHSR